MSGELGSDLWGVAMKILYSSTDVYEAVQEVLADPQPDDRRVVLVAYVGGRALEFLPNPEGLTIACCLQPGATDPVVLDRLKRYGATIYKSDRLHMKVYWSSSRGCVICSANASNNAFGGGGQKEAGALFSSGVVDIERLLAYAQPEAISASDLRRLASLSALLPKQINGSAGSPLPDFRECLSMCEWRDWKIGPWWIEGKFAKGAVQEAVERYGVSGPHDFIDVKRGQAKQGDWILTFQTPKVTSFRWLFVHFVTLVKPSDKRAYEKDYPFQAVQALPPKLCHPPPFAIDGGFRSAFRKSAKQFGIEALQNLTSLRPPQALLNLTMDNLASRQGRS
jgi:hypothetical protein